MQYKELGNDLTNYVSRPDFLIEAIHYIRTYGTDILYTVVVEFLGTITGAQLKSLLEAKPGALLLDEIQNWLATGDGIFNFDSVDKNKLRELYTKIERVRIPVIVNDKRPYMGEMVGEDEDMGIDPSIMPSPRVPFYSYRLGGYHDGEHWLTKSTNAQIKATAEIKGTVLTRYNQEAESGGRATTVLILLDKTDIVMIIKDLETLGPKTQAIRASTPDNEATTKVDESKFTDKSGNPLSSIKLSLGDLIGTTTK